MFLLCRPLLAFHFHRQIHPLLDQFLHALVVGNLFPHRADLVGPDKQGAALAAPAVAELVVGPMLLRILRILAVASRRAADVVLLADAARVHRSELGKLAFDLGRYGVQD